MNEISINPCKLKKKLKAPPSKSQTLRALIFGALASGISRIENYLDSPDTDAMILALIKMGARISKTASCIQVTGFGGRPKTPDDVIDCGNSGQVLRR